MIFNFREEALFIAKKSKKENILQIAEDSVGIVIAKNLQYLAKQSGLSEAEIARKIDCPPQTLNRMFRGLTPDPKISIVKKLSLLFEVPISSLLSENISTGLDKYKMLPLLEWEELAEINALSSLINRNNHRSWQPVNLEISNDAFLLKSKKSMSARFPLGTIFIVEPNTQPMDGDIVIIHFRENNIFTARELIIDGPEWGLKNIANELESFSFNASEHKIIGVVIEKRFFQSR